MEALHRRTPELRKDNEKMSTSIIYQVNISRFHFHSAKKLLSVIQRFIQELLISFPPRDTLTTLIRVM